MELLLIICFLVKQIQTIDNNTNVTLYDLSKSKLVIHSLGNKYIFENRTTKIQQLFKKKVLKNETSTDLLNQINKILSNETIFKNVTTSKTFTTHIEFNYSLQLITLLKQVNINVLQLQIRQFSKQDYLINLKSNLSLASQTNSSEIFLSISNDVANSCYKANNYSNYLLESVSFKMKKLGNFIICIQFFNHMNKNIFISNDNLCYEWIREPEFIDDTRLRYKPLFIVIMYLMCASILCPIAIGQHFMNKFKLQKKKQLKLKLLNEQENTSKDINSDKYLQNKISSDKEFEPLIDKFSTESQSQQLNPAKKVVLFDIESIHNSDDDNSGQEDDLKNSEANHILNDKPWLRSGPVLNDYKSSLNSVNIKIERKVVSEAYLMKLKGNKFNRSSSKKIAFKTSLDNNLNKINSQINAEKTVSNRSLNAKPNIYYETNV